MKKAIFSIFALLAVFAMVMTSCDTDDNSDSDDGTGLTFATAEGIKELTLSGRGFIEIDTETGIISRDAANGDDDYGNAFGVKIPEEYLPIIASDKITIKYIGNANAALTTKANPSFDDLVPPDYATFTGNNTVQQKVINATSYGANLPSEYLWFQGRPNPVKWELKILSITVERGSDIMITAGITGIKPVAGKTPVTTLGRPGYLQYTGTISWSPDDAAFAAETVYTATITLTKTAGYTFEGIKVNDFQVANAQTKTHEAGTSGDTLSIKAVFPATAAPAPDKILTFAEGDVKGHATTVTIFTDGKGYNAVTTAGYDGAWTYFKVTFDAGLILSDYTKISYTVKGITTGLEGDSSGYKACFMSVFATEAAVVSPAEDNLVFIESGWQATGVGYLDQENTRTVTVKVQPDTDLNEVWIAFRIGGVAGWTYELSNIKFHNK